MAMYAFSEIYEGHKARVWQLVSRYVASRLDREDLFQEVFLRIHQALPKFRGGSELSTWLYRITVNTALNYLKKQKRFSAIKQMLGNLRIMETKETVEIDDLSLFKPLQKLNPRQRMVLIMAEVEELKLEDISQLLNIPIGTVKSSLHRAKEIVKKEVIKHGGI